MCIRDREAYSCAVKPHCEATLTHNTHLPANCWKETASPRVSVSERSWNADASDEEARREMPATPRIAHNDRATLIALARIVEIEGFRAADPDLGSSSRFELLSRSYSTCMQVHVCCISLALSRQWPVQVGHECGRNSSRLPRADSAAGGGTE